MIQHVSIAKFLSTWLYNKCAIVREGPSYLSNRPHTDMTFPLVPHWMAKRVVKLVANWYIYFWVSYVQYQYAIWHHEWVKMLQSPWVHFTCHLIENRHNLTVLGAINFIQAPFCLSHVSDSDGIKNVTCHKIMEFP